MSIIEVGSESHFNSIVSSPSFETTIACLSTSWCGACQMMKPFFMQLAQTNPDVQFVNIDYDAQRSWAEVHNVKSMPTYILYKKGALSQERLEGADQSGLANMVLTNKPKNNSKQQQYFEQEQEPDHYPELVEYYDQDQYLYQDEEEEEELERIPLRRKFTEKLDQCNIL